MFCSTISQSKANTFLECKLKYLYRYVQRVPQDETNGDALHFGSYIHKIFEDGVECKNVEQLQEHAKTLKETYKFNSSYYRDTLRSRRVTISLILLTLLKLISV